MKRHAAHCVIAITLLGLPSVAAAAGALRANFSADTSQTLQGIPVSFRVKLVNDESDPVNIPQNSILIATNGRGETFVVLSAGSAIAYSFTGAALLGGKAQRVYDIATNGTFLKPGVFLDGRLYDAGVYHLQLLLTDAHVSPGTPIDDIARDAIKSNTIVLTVIEPHGIDAEVWQQMRRLTGGIWHPMKALTPAGEEFAKMVVARYPDSSYAGWFATFGLGRSIEARAELLREWLEDHAANSTVSDRRKLLLATWDGLLADTFELTDPQKSQQHAIQARAELHAVATESNDATIRAQAKRQLEEMADEPISSSAPPQ
ncbi:MAG TPA: hypothetical protein DHU55_08890 [Blastocatellia bacterium]|jgi:hypothetical protein|nr:hypothetical protein [Blastocatellia bacterium]